MEQKYSRHQHIYTDGSSSHHGVGIGVYSANETVSRKIDNKCSIFTAETAALTVAVNMIPEDQFYETVIFTDSASALLNLESGNSKNSMIQMLESKVENRSDITFCWVPSHCGIIGNEKADKLAGESHRAEAWESILPKQDINRWINSQLNLAWENQWQSTRDVFTRKIKGTTECWEDRKNRTEQRILSRLRTGHTRLTHRHYMGLGPREMCYTCGVPISVEHILVDCPCYTTQRQEILLSNSIREILGNNPESEQRLLKFLRETNLHELI